MNKKTLILSGIVIVIYLLVIFVPTGSNKKKTIFLKGLADDVAKIEMVLPDIGETSLNKVGEEWKVTDRKYPANEELVKKITDIFLEEMELEEVSLSETFSTYDLSETTRKTFILYNSGGEELRRIHFGKSASRFRSRYVTYDDEKTIFASITPIPEEIMLSNLDELRDKSVLNFLPKNLLEIVSDRFQGNGRTAVTTSLFRKEVGGDGQVNEGNDEGGKDDESGESVESGESEQGNDTSLKVAYVDENGVEYDYDKVRFLIGKLSNLKAKGFFEKKENKGLLSKALIKYDYKLSSRNESITIYNYDEESSGYPAEVSFNGQGYLLNKTDGEEIIIGFSASKK